MLLNSNHQNHFKNFRIENIRIFVCHGKLRSVSVKCCVFTGKQIIFLSVRWHIKNAEPVDAVDRYWTVFGALWDTVETWRDQWEIWTCRSESRDQYSEMLHTTGISHNFEMRRTKCFFLNYFCHVLLILFVFSDATILGCSQIWQLKGYSENNAVYMRHILASHMQIIVNPHKSYICR